MDYDASKSHTLTSNMILHDYHKHWHDTLAVTLLYEFPLLHQRNHVCFFCFERSHAVPLALFDKFYHLVIVLSIASITPSLILQHACPYNFSSLASTLPSCFLCKPIGWIIFLKKDTLINDKFPLVNAELFSILDVAD